VGPLQILHLFPESMGLYGDRGNALALKRRCEVRGIPAQIERRESVEDLSFSAADIVLIGGGADKDQERVAQKLASLDKAALREAIDAGLVVLAVCGGYQFLGLSYTTAGGEIIEGLGILPIVTTSGEGKRLIGNVEVSVPKELGGNLVGFENHGGRTWILGRDASPLGFVKYGYGNNSVDGTEGCRIHNCFGTYLHGPVLPNNPAFTDALISLALSRRKGDEVLLDPLDDVLEEAARERAILRCRQPAGLKARLGLEF
jgi:CobQ-like glutamine amidotransferase family enzyme